VRPSREGAGKTGCPPHPQPRVQNRKHTSVVATGRGGVTQPSLRNGFTTYSALSLVTGLYCHHPPCDAKHHHEVECQRRGVRTTRLRRPRSHVSSSARPRPSHSAPDTRDDREAPLLQRARNETLIVVILAQRKAENFSLTDWTGQITDLAPRRQAIHHDPSFRLSMILNAFRIYARVVSQFGFRPRQPRSFKTWRQSW
jgi:hypothetical protein